METVQESSSNQSSTSTPKLPAAFAKAQATFDVPKKTKQYLIQGKPVKYADLADVIEAVRKGLAENGLSITHRIGFCKGPFGLTTILMHESSETFETWYPLPDASKIRAQEFGAALTYARRYSISSLLGVASDEDIDGDGVGPADGKGLPKGKAENKPATGPKPITPPKAEPNAAGVPDYSPEMQGDPFPPDSAQITRLDELYFVVDEMGIPADDVKKYIKLVCGGAKKSTELTDAEIETLIKHIKIMGRPGSR